MRRVVLFVVSFVLVFTSCQKMPEFTAIMVHDQANVSVVKGLKRTMTIDENSYTVINGELHIQGQSNAVITLTDEDFARLEYISVDSAADLYIDTSQTIVFPNSVQIYVSGQGDLLFGGTFRSLLLSIEGEGTVKAENASADTVMLLQKDLTDLYAYGFNVNTYSIDVSGDATAELFANDLIAGTVRDNATVYYRGNPQVNVDVFDNGTFEPDTLK